MPGKILCVAEKNSISKAVAEHLSGGHFQTVSVVCDRVGDARPELNPVLGKHRKPIHQELHVHV
jgi:hypothetical protein